jgi:hypothetical protein
VISLDYHKLLLDFYSTEITSHSRLIIGLAVILFALAEIAKSFSRPVAFTQFWILGVGMFFVSFAFWFLLMRQLVYGVLINRVLHTENMDSFKKAHDEVTHDTIIRGQTIFFRIPVSWFISVGDKYKRWYRRPLGVLVCATLAFFTTLHFLFLLNLKTVEEFFTEISGLFQAFWNLLRNFVQSLIKS